jgi:hypothetical protein
MRDFGKVHTQFWASTSVRELSEDARMLALYLLTCPHGTIAGVFRLPDGYACEDLKWSSERVSKGFHELFRKGFANRCETTKWVWVLKHFEWNALENPNQRKSAVKVCSQIPGECAWKLDFMRVCGPILGIEAPKNTNPSETLSKGFLNQEQEQEQEQDKDMKVSPSLSGQPSAVTDPPELPESDENDDTPPGVPRCPHKRLLALWAKHLPHLMQPRVWDGARATAMRQRWVEASRPSSFSPEGYATEEGGMAWWDSFFRYVATETTLSKGFTTGERTWVPDLPWVLTARNFANIIDGKYAK